MTLAQACLLVGTAIIAGALNSVAGGGSFFTFPALVFTGVPPIQANATNTIAVWPGTVASAGAYRKELAASREHLLVLSIVSVVGGVLGAILLLHTSQKTFSRLIPFLLLLATLLFAFGGRLAVALRARIVAARGTSRLMKGAVALLQLVIATYGGFFGGGIGILMLAALALMGMENMHEMNALKTVLASCINGVALVTFVVARVVFWPQALVMVVGATIGGYLGAYYARKLDPRIIYWFVIAVGCAMTVYFFVR